MGGGIPRSEVGKQTREYTEYFEGGPAGAKELYTRNINYKDVVNKCEVDTTSDFPPVHSLCRYYDLATGFYEYGWYAA